MRRKSLNLILLSVPLSVLAACSGGNDTATPSPPPTVVVPPEDTFGATFGTAFRASSESTPIEPKDGDIIPVSLTAEPVDVK